MSVKVALIGRLGNNLFQYALGRIVAEKLGLELECVREESAEPDILFMGQRLDCGPCATLENFQHAWPNAPLRLAGCRIERPVQKFDIGPKSSWSGQKIDLAAILEDPTPRKIVLAGYFQRFEYFADWIAPIRKWFDMKTADTPFRIHANDVVLNFRRSMEYAFFQNMLGLSYYHRALSHLDNLGRVYVCGTGIDDQVRQSLKEYKPIYFSGSPIEDFSFIKRFQRIILSNSTFAWWSALLSDARAIYAPRSVSDSCYAFTGYRDVDLHMRDSRYIEVENNEVALLAPFVLNRNALAMLRNRNTERLSEACAGMNDEPEFSLKLLKWMAELPGGIPFVEMCERFGFRSYGVCQRLVKAGLLDITHNSYIDPSSSTVF